MLVVNFKFKKRWQLNYREKEGGPRKKKKRGDSLTFGLFFTFYVTLKNP
jgi:hypothetical protein